MCKILKAIYFACLLAIWTNGCSSLQFKNEEEATINPSKFDEECMELMRGDVLSYSFKSSEAVDFNIHYHEEGNVVYPVSSTNSTGEDGKFSSEKEQTYCLMWTNTQTKPVRLTYTFNVERKSKEIIPY